MQNQSAYKWSEREIAELERLREWETLMRSSWADRFSGGRVHVTTGAGFSDSGQSGPESRTWRGLSEEDALLRDLLASFPWHSAKAGRTGQGRGRPRRYPSNPFLIVDAFRRQQPQFELAEMAATLGKKRRTATERERWHELARVVASVLSAPRGHRPALSVEAVAAFLGCSVNTIYRLRIKGRQMQKKSPKGGEADLRPSTYWAFRGWTPIQDPEDPFQMLYAPPTRYESIGSLVNLPVLKEGILEQEAA